MQPAKIPEFTIESAIAYKDPSVILQSSIYYNQFYEWKEGIGLIANN